MKLIGSGVVAMLLAWPVIASEAQYRPILAGSDVLMGMRMMASSLIEGRFALTQVRVAVPTGLNDEGASRERSSWELRTESTYAVDCFTQPKAVGLVQRAENVQSERSSAPDWRLVSGSGHVSLAHLTLAPLPTARTNTLGGGLDAGARTGSQSLVDEHGISISSPPELAASAAYACALVKDGLNEADAAAMLQRTAALQEEYEFNCSLQNRKTGANSDLVLAFSEYPPVVRLGDKWLSKGLIAPE